jgi:hypothetical protein
MRSLTLSFYTVPSLTSLQSSSAPPTQENLAQHAAHGSDTSSIRSHSRPAPRRPLELLMQETAAGSSALNIPEWVLQVSGVSHCTIITIILTVLSL